MNLRKRWQARQKRLDYCRGRSSESPFCRCCGISIFTGWQCEVCNNTGFSRKLEPAHKLLVTGLKAAYHLALVCDTVPYNGYGHPQWDDYHRIQDWLDDNQPPVTIPMKDGIPSYSTKG